METCSSIQNRWEPVSFRIVCQLKTTSPYFYLEALCKWCTTNTMIMLLLSFPLISRFNFLPQTYHHITQNWRKWGLVPGCCLFIGYIKIRYTLVHREDYGLYLLRCLDLLNCYCPLSCIDSFICILPQTCCNEWEMQMHVDFLPFQLLNWLKLLIILETSYSS